MYSVEPISHPKMIKSDMTSPHQAPQDDKMRHNISKQHCVRGRGIISYGRVEGANFTPDSEAMANCSLQLPLEALVSGRNHKQNFGVTADSFFRIS